MYTHTIGYSLLAHVLAFTEVKFKPQHTEGAEHANVEPITPETISKMEKPMVETTCQSSKSKS